MPSCVNWRYLEILFGPVAEAVDVHRHRQARRLLHALLAGDHVRRELVHDEELLGQVVPAHDGRDVARDGVDVLGLDRADPGAGHRAGRVPLGVEREADVGLAQPAVEVARLGEEVGVPGLDVEHEQRLGAPGRAPGSGG